MSKTPNTPQILDELKSEAIKVLSSALGSKTLESFQLGPLGNYPFNWQSSLLVTNRNGLNYDWISTDISQKDGVVTPGQSIFTNKYLTAAMAISYGYSTIDLGKVSAAATLTTNQASALQNGWIAAFGALPAFTAPNTAINAIMAEIQTNWTTKGPVTLMDIQQSFNLNELLDNTPAAGKSVQPLLVNYLNAMNSVISLLNASSTATGYLAAAIRAIQSPSATNGAVNVANSPNPVQVMPAYTVAPAMNQIQNALADAGNSVKLSMTVSRSTSDQYTVSIKGKTGFSIPVLSFFSLGLSASASYFKDSIATKSNTVSIEMTYPGVNLVTYGPKAFSQAGRTSDWYWLDPITKAIANTGKDVSGYKFLPDPGIDFSKNGSFGFLEGVAIAGYPTVVIKVTSSDFSKITTEVTQSVSVSASFLGIPLGGGSESTYSKKVDTDSSSKTVTITLSPPPELIGGTADSSVAWVLGAIPNFPAS